MTDYVLIWNHCLETVHFKKICNYLNDIKKDELVAVGTSLGLSYCKLRDLAAEQFPYEMVLWWLQRKHKVQKVSGPPTLKSLIDALEEIGLSGHATKIKDENQHHGSKWFMIESIVLYTSASDDLAQVNALNKSMYSFCMCNDKPQYK